MEIFGFRVEVIFLLSKNEILAYAWHHTKEKALKHMNKIIDFHDLNGEIMASKEMEIWLERWLDAVVLQGKKFKLPKFEYKNKEIYEALLDIPKGKTIKYSEVARTSGFKFSDVLVTLMRNPFQILIPCHRLITNKGSLMGFYPLGVELKKKLLEMEGVKIE